MRFRICYKQSCNHISLQPHEELKQNLLIANDNYQQCNIYAHSKHFSITMYILAKNGHKFGYKKSQ
jgi:predicted RNA-binding protein associated with RNAse of E/G family